MKSDHDPVSLSPLAARERQQKFIEGLHADRAWLRDHPHAACYRRELTAAECQSLEVFLGSAVLAKRDARGGVMWCLALVEKPTSSPAARN